MKDQNSINNFFLSGGQPALPKFTHGSLFSGIGAFELGARNNGIETLWNCEIQEYNRKVLKKNFPNTKQYDDITKLYNPEYVDIMSVGSGYMAQTWVFVNVKLRQGCFCSEGKQWHIMILVYIS